MIRSGSALINKDLSGRRPKFRAVTRQECRLLLRSQMDLRSYNTFVTRKGVYNDKIAIDW